LAAKLTGWKIDITSANSGEELAEADADGTTEVEAPLDTAAGADDSVIEGEVATTTKPDIEEVLKESEETQSRDAYGPFEENDVDTPEEAEEQLAEAEANESTLGEAEVEVADMAEGNMTDGLESQAPAPEAEAADDTTELATEDEIETKEEK
jgi:hypothetical protein